MNSDRAKAILEECVQIVDEARLAADLRPTAFRVLLERAFGPAATAAPGASAGPARIADEDGEKGGELAKIANRLRLELSTVERIFDVDGAGLHLQIARGVLPDARKAAQQEVAVLVASGRQACGLDSEWTQLKMVREICDDLGVLDSSNFSKAMNALNGHGVRLRDGKELKVNQVGYERAAEIVTRMAGSET